MKYVAAEPADLHEIELLLKRHNLPFSDCADHLNNFVLAKENGKLVGMGGLEICANYGLIRSFAVLPQYSGQGIALNIFKNVLERALSQNVRALYLLTTTASGYFSNLGFSICQRGDCPQPIQQTKQFSELCPGSAIAMCRVLRK